MRIMSTRLYVIWGCAPAAFHKRCLRTHFSTHSPHSQSMITSLSTPTSIAFQRHHAQNENSRYVSPAGTLNYKANRSQPKKRSSASTSCDAFLSQPRSDLPSSCPIISRHGKTRLPTFCRSPKAFRCCQSQRRLPLPGSRRRKRLPPQAKGRTTLPGQPSHCPSSPTPVMPRAMRSTTLPLKCRKMCSSTKLRSSTHACLHQLLSKIRASRASLWITTLPIASYPYLPLMPLEAVVAAVVEVEEDSLSVNVLLGEDKKRMVPT